MGCMGGGGWEEEADDQSIRLTSHEDWGREDYDMHELGRCHRF